MTVISNPDGPATLLAYALRAAALTTDNTLNLDWPGFATATPDKPDNAVTVIGTIGFNDSRDPRTGQYTKHPGFQVRVRSKTTEVGQQKAEELYDEMAAWIRREVTTPSARYQIHSVSLKGDVLPLGREKDKQTFLHVFNGLVSFTLTEKF